MSQPAHAEKTPSAPVFDVGTASAVAPIIVNDVEFRCFIVDQGQRYEWRDGSCRLRGGRLSGSKLFWAAVDGVVIGREFTKFRDAFFAATRRL